MDVGLKVGNEISMKEAAEPVAEAVVRVLAALAEGRHDRETAIAALEVIGLTAGINGTTITNCTIGDQIEHTQV